MSESGGDTVTAKNYVQTFIAGYVVSLGVLYLFYRHWLLCAILALAGGAVYIPYRKKKNEEQRKWTLMTEFKDAMDSMTAALTAGYSMENGITEAHNDLLLLYGKETQILKDLKEIQKNLQLQRPLDELLMNWGKESGVEDIVTFAQIYATARKSGGNLVKIMKRTAENISEKIEIQREIQTMIAGKKMEATCMMVMPLLIIVYMQLFSADFMTPLYQGVAGRAVMSGALAIYMGAVLWSRALMNIQC